MSHRPPSLQVAPLPSIAQAERSLLGAMMLDECVVDEAALVLTPADFFSDKHRALYQVLLARREAGESLDLSLVVPAIERAGQAHAVGGLGYLTSLLDTADTATAPSLALSIAEDAERRRVVAQAAELEAAAREGIQGISALHRMAEAISSGQQVGAAEWQTPMDLSSDVLEATERSARGEQVDALPGLPGSLARRLSLCRGHQVVIAARPGMGKTALATKIATEMSRRGHGVGFVSLEMSARDLWQRMASEVSHVPYGSLRRPRDLDAGTWHAYRDGLDQLAAWPLFILDERGLTVEDIRRHARRLRARMQSKGVTMGALIVDYVGLVKPSDTSPSRQIQVGHISRTLRELGKELDVVVLLLSQLNRDSEKRGSGRPIMSDLRESGDLEQDADAVVLCYRDEVMNPDSSKYPGLGEINLAKWRHGEPGIEYLEWDGSRVAWGDRVLDAGQVQAQAGAGSWG